MIAKALFMEIFLLFARRRNSLGGKDTMGVRSSRIKTSRRIEMIAPAQIFATANGLATVGWVALAVSLFTPKWQIGIRRMTGYVIPALFAVLYIFYIWKGSMEASGGGFGSIAEVRALFANDSALLAGWLHYLAFDLFVGTWIVRRGTLDGVNRFLLLLCLPITFMFGPIGFLVFLTERAVFARRSAGDVP
jgi:hypothetical protein